MAISNKEMEFLDSCKLCVEDLEHICEQYDIGRLKHIHRHFEDTANINILIESEKGRFVAKFFRVEPERYMDIVHYMENIQRCNVPVILPLHNINKNYLAHIKEYDVQITPYVIAYPFKYTSKNIQSSGQILKRIHTAISDDFEISEPGASVYPSTSVIDESKMRIEALRGSITDKQISLINNLYTRIVSRWVEQAGGLPHAIIHGDWKAENQLFTSNGDVCAILDFDFVQRKERLFDIAYFLYNFYEHWNNPIMSTFIEGYGPLMENEVEMLYLAIARVSFFFLCTASYETNAVMNINQQLEKQVPIIENVLSDRGRKRLIELCNETSHGLHTSKPCNEN